ncbi:unnamed protein product, partial [marine sediment metagenome]
PGAEEIPLIGIFWGGIIVKPTSDSVHYTMLDDITFVGC